MLPIIIDLYMGLNVYCHQKQQAYLNIYLLGAQSEPVL